MGPSCREDQDGDGWAFSDDNADSHFNPGQIDRDGDGVGDIIDLCVFDTSDRNNSADSDNDGVGNACDRCPQTLTQYNENATRAGAPAELLVRGNPYQHDTDGDGIADPCDNCVVVPNCQGFGNDTTPYQIGDTLDDDSNDCQADDNANFIGDACEGLELPGAAGPVGLAPTDDFDQDGMSNAADGCPRLPLPDGLTNCTAETAAEACGADRPCVEGVCGHVDSDADGIGNLCDTCPEVPNPDQLSGEDDQDGDFIGSACESAAADTRKNAPPLNFVQVSVSGLCCTTELLEVDAASAAGTNYEVGDLVRLQDCDLEDLDACKQLTRLNPALMDLELGEGIAIVDVPVRRAEHCSDAQVAAAECAVLPQSEATRPGVLTPPHGCEAALDAAGISAADNRLAELLVDDFAGEPNPQEALWMHGCHGPASDQDFDGLPDQIDFCAFSFDPSNMFYIDSEGGEWPNDGAACNGNFSPDNVCDLREMNE